MGIEERRKFLKFLFAATITSVVPPHKLLGKIFPTLKNKEDELLGIYGISLLDYPQLNDLWGSVRIKVEGTIMYYPKIIIVRVPKDDYNVDFICVSERCPHEGYPIKDLDTDTHLFECSGHGTLFDVTGKYVWGPASRDLERINLHYDGDKTIYLEIPLYPLTKLEEKKDLAYLHQNNPNPCSDITEIQFGCLSPSFVEIKLFDMKGNFIKTIFAGECSSAGDIVRFSVEDLSNGSYLYRMFINGKPFNTKKMIVTK